MQDWFLDESRFPKLLGWIIWGMGESPTQLIISTSAALNYAATHPNADTIYCASDMILQIDSDAACLLVAPGAREAKQGGGMARVRNIQIVRA